MLHDKHDSTVHVHCLKVYNLFNLSKNKKELWVQSIGSPKHNNIHTLCHVSMNKFCQL